ncbi:MAG: nucleotidyltransferase domain-containing protein [Deltaproteobacteria bacterium]|nr:nucleotidyltransferase domain-containing protein [Deltaproteobacteria bacterium]
MIARNRLHEIIKEYRSRLVATFGDDLEATILYGSQARKEAVEGSDIDVLCVMNKPFRYGDLIKRTSQATAEVSLKYDVVISRVFVTREVYESHQSPFLMNVHKEELMV